MLVTLNMQRQHIWQRLFQSSPHTPAHAQQTAVATKTAQTQTIAWNCRGTVHASRHSVDPFYNTVPSPHSHYCHYSKPTGTLRRNQAAPSATNVSQVLALPTLSFSALVSDIPASQGRGTATILTTFSSEPWSHYPPHEGICNFVAQDSMLRNLARCILELWELTARWSFCKCRK